MTEVRSIRADEADQFLQVLSDVFDLDFSRARSVFYSEPYFDLSRKWALFQDGRMVSILTTAPLQFGWGSATGIAGVATIESDRRRGHAGTLIRAVVEQLGPSLLFARDARLYDLLGFVALGRVVQAEIVCDAAAKEISTVPFDYVRACYERWSLAKPQRLRRDELRWKSWQWNYRICEHVEDGYLAAEPSVLREAVIPKAQESLPLPSGTKWYGLESVAMDLALPLKPPSFDMHFMGYRIPAKVSPEMFMTDQF